MASAWKSNSVEIVRKAETWSTTRGWRGGGRSIAQAWRGRGVAVRGCSRPYSKNGDTDVVSIVHTASSIIDDHPAVQKSGDIKEKKSDDPWKKKRDEMYVFERQRDECVNERFRQIREAHTAQEALKVKLQIKMAVLTHVLRLSTAYETFSDGLDNIFTEYCKTCGNKEPSLPFIKQISDRMNEFGSVVRDVMHSAGTASSSAPVTEQKKLETVVSTSVPGTTTTIAETKIEHMKVAHLMYCFMDGELMISLIKNDVNDQLTFMETHLLDGETINAAAWRCFQEVSGIAVDTILQNTVYPMFSISGYTLLLVNGMDIDSKNDKYFTLKYDVVMNHTAKSVVSHVQEILQHPPLKKFFHDKIARMKKLDTIRALLTEL